MNKNIVLVTGQKGGVAKTLTSALLLGRMRAPGTCTVAAYDADGSIGGLQRHMGTRGADGKLLAQQDPHSGVVAYNIHAAQERDMLLNSLEVGSDIVMHDLAGGSLDDLLATVDGSSGRLDNLMETIADCGYATTLVHMITTDAASWHSLATWLDNAEGHDVCHIAVVNRHFGGEAAFAGWQVSRTRQRLIDAGGLEIELPAFPVPVLDKIKAARVPFEMAAVSGPLTITERANYRRCKRLFDTEIAPVLASLGLPA